MFRPRIDAGDEESEDELAAAVEAYAEERGLTKPRAYYRIVRAGLDCEGEAHEHLLDKKVPGWEDEVDERVYGGY